MAVAVEPAVAAMTGFAARVVEVVADLGADVPLRWRHGSGCLVNARTVLTAAHVIDRAVAVTVVAPDKGEYQADLDNALVGHPQGGTQEGAAPDLAVIEVPGWPTPAAPLPVARIDRDSTTVEPIPNAHTIGYPLFAETPITSEPPAPSQPPASASQTAGPMLRRETVHAFGTIPVLSGLVGGLLSLQVGYTPRDLPPEEGQPLAGTPWEGMSGAPVIAEAHLVGVVTIHAPRQGANTITFTPLTAVHPTPGRPLWGPGVPSPQQWWTRLGIPPSDPDRPPVLPVLPVLPVESLMTLTQAGPQSGPDARTPFVQGTYRETASQHQLLVSRQAVSGVLRRTLNTYLTAAVHPDRPVLATVTGFGSRAFLWDTEAGTLRGGVGTDKNDFVTPLFSDDPSLVVLRPAEGPDIEVWDIDSREIVCRIDTGFPFVGPTAVSGNGEVVVATATGRHADGRSLIRAYSTRTGRSISTMSAQMTQVKRVELSHDGIRLAVQGWGSGYVECWNTQMGKIFDLLIWEDGWMYCLFEERSTHVIEFDEQYNELNVWLLRDWTSPAGRKVCERERILRRRDPEVMISIEKFIGAAIPKSRKFIVFACYDLGWNGTRVEVRDLATGECWQRLDDGRRHDQSYPILIDHVPAYEIPGQSIGHRLALSPDERLLATAAEGKGTAHLWDPLSGKKVATVNLQSGIEWLHFRPDGQLLCWTGSGLHCINPGGFETHP